MTTKQVNLDTTAVETGGRLPTGRGNWTVRFHLRRHDGSITTYTETYIGVEFGVAAVYAKNSAEFLSKGRDSAKVVKFEVVA